jgi:hypothetical protein
MELNVGFDTSFSDMLDWKGESRASYYKNTCNAVLNRCYTGPNLIWVSLKPKGVNGTKGLSVRRVLQNLVCNWEVRVMNRDKAFL